MLNPEEARLKALRDTFEQRAIWAGALTAARNAPEMEKFATWVLGITGAAFALLIGNLDKIVALIGPIATALIMVLMLLSAYFGFVARFQAYQIKVYVNLHDDKSLEIGDAYQAAGGQLDLRMDKVDAAVRRIVSPEIEELSGFGKSVWRLTDWFIALPAPKPNLEGLEPEYTGVKETAFRAGTVLRCVVWQMAALFCAVIVASAALLWRWAH